jgi:hypothetical protein
VLSARISLPPLFHLHKLSMFHSHIGMCSENFFRLDHVELRLVLLHPTN